MERRAQTIGGRRRVVSRCGLSLRSHGNLRRPRDHFDRSASRNAWNGGKRMVGPRTAKIGDVYRGYESKKSGVWRSKRDGRRLGLEDAGAVVRGRIEISNGREHSGGHVFAEGARVNHHGGAQGCDGNMV